MEEYFSIGDIVAAHGLKGDLTLRHGLKTNRILQEVKVIFIPENPGSYLPYFIEECQGTKKGTLRIRLEGFASRNAVLALVGKQVYLSKSDYLTLSDLQSPHTWLGFGVYDTQKGFLGKIIEILEMPSQILARLDWQGKSILIPLNGEILRKQDMGNRLLTVTIPDGLLDLPD